MKRLTVEKTKNIRAAGDACNGQSINCHPANGDKTRNAPRGK